MNLKRQLLLVSLLTLMLPWAGCEFIRETETALREAQQDFLLGHAHTLANTLSQYGEEFPAGIQRGNSNDRVYIHELRNAPSIDGYYDDWSLQGDSLVSLRGPEGTVRYALGAHAGDIYLYVEVADRAVVFASDRTMILDDGPRFADRVSIVSSSPPYRRELYLFAAEAPGAIMSYRMDDYGFKPEHAIAAHWQDIPRGYRLEARLPGDLVGTNVGLIVRNTASQSSRGTRVASYRSQTPGLAARPSADLQRIVEPLLQSGMRLIITDADGWRMTVSGELENSAATAGSAWSRHIYDLLVESGDAATLAEPDPHGRELQTYVSAALDGRETPGWYRAADSGRAIVAVAAPIGTDGNVLGSLVLQQSTDAILSLTNAGLVRLINVTLIATLVVALVLLGYATWLSRRIRHLSVAAEDALDAESLHAALPSALADDEIGDLSRSFSFVLGQLGDYNAYLKTLASKLSHELRTPLAIVTSSLENLEHENLDKESRDYLARASEGADRLRRILSAMSEASRVEQLMEHAEPEVFDLRAVMLSTIEAYRDAYSDRAFDFECDLTKAQANGSPELLIQMLDKLVDNAVGFSDDGDTVKLGLSASDDSFAVSVENPGPPLPERMRGQLFDSMVSMRGGENSRHLGLGLYVAKLIAEGHGGRIEADNVQNGVRFTVRLPRTELLDLER